MYFFWMYNLSTKTHEGPSSQRRPTQAHEEGKRPICMFFFIMYFFKNLQLIHESLRRPTATNDGQRRPTKARSSPRKANAGPRRLTAPNDNRYVFFNNVLFFKFTTYSRRPTKTERKPTRAHKDRKKAHEGPQQPTKADAGPRRGTNGPNDARRVVWAGIGKSFLMYFFLMYNLSTKAHEGPTKADTGPQREKTV